MRSHTSSVSRARSLGILALAVAGLGSTAWGVDYSWTLGTSGSWNNPAAWTPAAVPNATSDTATITNTGAVTVTVDAPITVKSITMSSTAAGTIALGTGGSLRLEADTGGIATIATSTTNVFHGINIPFELASNLVVNTANGSRSVNIAAAITSTGSFNITKMGAAKLDFTTTNAVAVSGDWDVQKGSLRITSDANLGDSNNDIKMADDTLFGALADVTLGANRVLIASTSGAGLTFLCNSGKTLTLDQPTHITGNAALAVNQGILAITTAQTAYNYTQAASKGGALTTPAVLRTNDGVGLRTAAKLTFGDSGSYGMLESYGTASFTRLYGTLAGQFSNSSGNGGYGFSAMGGKMTVNIGNDSAEVSWATTTNGSHSLGISNAAGKFMLGSGYGDAVTEFVNPLNLDAGSRTIYVRDNTAVATDYSVISGAISNGSLIKDGSGLLALSGANAYAGTTTVTAGVLQVNNTHTGAGAYTGAGGATLGGTGTIDSAVTMASGGKLAPGASVGVLTVASLSLNANPLNFEGDSSGFDKLVVTATDGLTLAGVSTFNLTDLGGVVAGTYTLIDYAATTALTDLSAFTLGSGTLGSFTVELVNNTTNTSVDLKVNGVSAVTNAAWAVDSDGSWSVGTNWTGGVPNGIDHVANFGTIITATKTVTVDGPQTVGAINFSSPIAYTLSGSGTVTLDVSAGNAAINVSAGNHVIDAPIVLAKNTDVSVSGGGSLSVKHVRGQGLNLTAGNMAVSAKATANDPEGTSVVSALSIAGGAALDLANNSLVLDYGSVGTLVDDTRVMLQSGKLTSSSADSSKRLGYADNAVTGLTTFGGQVVDSTSILVKFTYGGDSNLDGQVDISDLGSLATAWQTSAPWTGGDFDYSGFVDISDLGILATNWQLGVGAPLGPSFDEALASVGLSGVSVPEPTAIGLLGLCLAGVASRRHRREAAAAKRA